MDDQDTPAARQARQFAWLRRAGEMAMRLVEASGAAAIAEIERSGPPDPAPTPRRTTHAQEFLQAVAAIRHVIALELRVESGSAPARSGKRPTVTPPPDPRRPLLQKVLHDAVRNDPNRARRRREIDENIELELLADPDHTDAEPIAETLGIICDRLHIEVDLARVPDAFLDYDEPIKTLSQYKIPERPS